MSKEYAIYKGDTFIDLGTIEYLSQKYKISKQVLRNYTSSKYHTRNKGNAIILVKIEEDDYGTTK